MITFITFIILPIFPLILFAMAGYIWAYKAIALYLVTVLALLLGFGTGLGLSFLFQPGSWWKEYELPTLWFKTYMNSLSTQEDAPLYKYVLGLPIAFVDCIRVYVHFNFDRGGLPLWIPEFASFYIIRNYGKVILS